jgi:hypothetical protein
VCLRVRACVCAWWALGLGREPWIALGASGSGSCKGLRSRAASGYPGVLDWLACVKCVSAWRCLAFRSPDLPPTPSLHHSGCFLPPLCVCCAGDVLRAVQHHPCPRRGPDPVWVPGPGPGVCCPGRTPSCGWGECSPPPTPPHHATPLAPASLHAHALGSQHHPTHTTSYGPYAVVGLLRVLSRNATLRVLLLTFVAAPACACCCCCVMVVRCLLTVVCLFAVVDTC